MKFNQFFLLFLFTVFFTACSNNDDETYNDLPLGDYDNGILILNEGNYGNDNSTISFLSDDFTTFQADAYTAVNNQMLGNTAQSIGFYNDYAFVVVNGSNIIEVLNRYTLEKLISIEGFSNPRYIAFANGKGYVTNWGDATIATDDYIAVLNLTNNTIESTISVAEGPEKIKEVNNTLYVAHKGGYGYGNSISVINTVTNSVETTITVGDIPTEIIKENEFLYVLCSGNPSWIGNESAGKLLKINVDNLAVTDVITFATTEHPSNLAIENENAYYTLNSVVYKVDLNASTGLQGTALINLAENQGSSYEYAYGFAVKNNKIFVADAKDFSSNGKVYIYSLTGVLENEFEVKTSPNGFYFN